MLPEVISGCVAIPYKDNFSENTYAVRAFDYYCLDKKPEDLKYLPTIRISNSNAIMDWVEDGDKYLDEQAEMYIKAKGDIIRDEMRHWARLAERLAQLYKTNGRHVTAKKLLQAVSDYQTVVITVLRDKKQYTFKYHTIGLGTNQVGVYPTYHICQQAILSSSGLKSSFTIEEIKQVEYRNKIIFEQDLPQEKTEKAG